MIEPMRGCGGMGDGVGGKDGAKWVFGAREEEVGEGGRSTRFSGSGRPVGGRMTHSNDQGRQSGGKTRGPLT